MLVGGLLFLKYILYAGLSHLSPIGLCAPFLKKSTTCLQKKMPF